MNVILLRDLEDGCVDGVITSFETTTEELQEIIREVRNKEDFQWDDLIDSLPKDCTLYSRWTELKELPEIYY